MTATVTAMPPVVSREEWLAKRLPLLEKEKELTRQKDRINAERRRLPMVKVEKSYEFDTPTGKRSLLDLFEGKRQLIVYHFMFAPEDEKGCPGCTSYANALGDIDTLPERDTIFTMVSRAPLAKLEAYKKLHGWDLPWVSSNGSDFNYDFHVTLDPKVAPPEYNYRSQPEETGERPGLSVFFRDGNDIYHTYSTFARGAENVTDGYALLDLTPYGRQEDFEDSPPGWPQHPTYG